MGKLGFIKGLPLPPISFRGPFKDLKGVSDYLVSLYSALSRWTFPTAKASVPTGTGFRHVSDGAEDGAAKLVENADVSGAAAIIESKLSLNYATHSNTNDPSACEKAALAGTSGSPGDSNKYVTNADTRNTNARTPTAHGSAAHTGTIVLIENIENGKVAPAVVNDRGPFVSGRIVDLSEALAVRLGFQKQGLAEVRLYPLPIRDAER